MFIDANMQMANEPVLRSYKMIKISKRRMELALYSTLVLTFMRVSSYINETLYVKGFVLIVLAVLGVDVAKHAKDAVGMMSQYHNSDQVLHEDDI